MTNVLESKKVPGLLYIPDLITEEEEKDLFEELDAEEWIPITSSENSRVVQHYGFKYDYMSGKPGEKTHPLPKFLNSLRDKLEKVCLEEGIIKEGYEFNQCIVNNYEPGQGISDHVDHKDYGHTIGCFTIGSGAEMTFMRVQRMERGAKSKVIKVNIYPEPRSLYIMTGECRKVWSHCMVGRKSDPNPTALTLEGVKAMSEPKRIKRGRRISVTFRKVPRK